MPQGGFLEQKPRSPGGLAIVIALHAAAIGALALSKMEMPVKVFTPIKVDDIEIDTPPPEKPPEPVDEKIEVRPKSRIDNVPPRVPTPPRETDVVLRPDDNVVIFDRGPSGEAEAQKPVDPPKPPPPDPVPIQAKLDSRSALQPPYPPSELRLGDEGSVTVRVTIGSAGRVIAVEKIRSTSDAFYRATERHALRHWRFSAATLDGRPVESRMTMTVHFKLEG